MSTEDFRATVKNLLDDMVYHCNVDTDDIEDFVTPVLTKIMDAMPKPGITIDLAGAMEKITPDMMDNMRDIMIEAMVKRAGEMQKALQPFANCVYNDNGDITLSTDGLRTSDYVKAYHTCRGEPTGPWEASSAWVNAKTPPREGTTATVLFKYRWEKQTLRELGHGAVYRDGKWRWLTMREKDEVLAYHTIPSVPEVI